MCFCVPYSAIAVAAPLLYFVYLNQQGAAPADILNAMRYMFQDHKVVIVSLVAMLFLMDILRILQAFNGWR